MLCFNDFNADVVGPCVNNNAALFFPYLQLRDAYERVRAREETPAEEEEDRGSS